MDIDHVCCAADQDDRNLEDLEELVWDANRAPPDQQIDQFMILARQVDSQHCVCEHIGPSH